MTRYFTVFIKGDRDLAAGLLAKAGVQNIGNHSYFVGRGDDQEAGVQSITARASADSADEAEAKVRAALGDGPFTVGDAEPESD